MLFSYIGEVAADHGTLCIKPRQTPELTAFHVEDFLPLPPVPVEDQHQLVSLQEDEEEYYLNTSTVPLKGKPSMSKFGVQIQVYPTKPLELCYLNSIAANGSNISRGGYLLLAEQSPNNLAFHNNHPLRDNDNDDQQQQQKSLVDYPSLTLHIHHDKVDSVYHSLDPIFNLPYYTLLDSVRERVENGLKTKLKIGV